MPLTRCCVAWLDAAGNERLTYLTSDAGATVTMLQLATMSNAVITGNWEGAVNLGPGGAPSAGMYSSVGDMLVLNCTSLIPSESRIFVPAPKLSLFQLDSQSFDSSSPDSMILTADLAADCVVPITGFNINSITTGNLLRRASGARETYQGAYPPSDVRRSMVFADVFGRTTMSIVTCSSSGFFAQLGYINSTNAVLTQWWEGPFLTGPANPTIPPGNYPSVRDYAQFVFSDDRGNLANVILPAPVDTIFLADTTTVDASEATVAALIIVVEAELTCPSSNRPLVQYISGQRRLLKSMGLGQGPI